MLRRLTNARTIVAVSAFVGIGSVAQAAYVPVDLSGYVDTSFSNLINATAVLYPTGSNLSGLTAVPFDIANTAPPAAGGYGLNFWGGFPGSSVSPADNGMTLMITGLNITNVTTAYTLVNSTFGTVGDYPTTVTFVSTGGNLTFNLYEGSGSQQVRDYNDGIYNNSIASPTLNWFNNGGTGPAGTGEQQRLDQQTYDLSSLSGFTVTEVDITSNPVCINFDPNTGLCDPAGSGASSGGETTIFAGLTFQTEQPAGVPEPATLALLTLGVAGLGFSRRKH